MYTRNLQHTTSAILERVQKEYSVLAGDEPVFSLLQLFNFEGFKLDEYCQVFSPHPRMHPLLKDAKDFSEHYGVWLPNAEHYISCAAYLFPDASEDRMGAILQNCAIDFYLNDTVGREVFFHLSAEEQEKASQIKKRLVSIPEDLFNDEDIATPVEMANTAMLTAIRDTSPFSWFREFLRLYSYHIHVAHMDCNAEAMGHIPSVKEYIYNRGHISGMFHTIALIEYGTGQFLDWEWLEAIGASKALKRTHEVVSAIGCLMNDLFSFEKEVIVNTSDSNLVMVILLNDPELSLQTAIERAAVVVRNHLIEFLGLVDYIRVAVNECDHKCPERTAIIAAQLKGLERCVQASWIWQVYTRRYKSECSIFQETRLENVLAAR